jgi:GT2 family glycosyltransferase/glycosyltransferase involved in cell wall biosynthesis
MHPALRSLAAVLRALLLLIVSPVLLLIVALALAFLDLAFLLAGRRKPPADRRPDVSAASVVIPNWNGRDLLARYIPPLIEALAGNPHNEIVVVDNGSEDGSAQFLHENFPRVKVVELVKNLGFGGGSNAGFREARNDIVVLLNSDMRVDRGFLAPLLAGFTDEKIFAVSCQIFLSDPAKRREETGLTEGWWEDGSLRVSHREDSLIDRLYPCFYGGGGSCAFDRRKFLELGGFDELLAPFYLEDTDIGYQAWKRGWKVLYQPASKVWHEHRGTIGRKFSQQYIDSVLKKNFLLFVWKNIHERKRIVEHLVFSWTGAAFSLMVESPERTTFRGILRAFQQLPGALKSRWRARSLAVIDDTEAFRRPQGGYFRDRFLPPPDPEARLCVAFASPYPICPPVHGGGVFMYGTLVELSRQCDVHVLVNMEYPHQVDAHRVLDTFCSSVATPYCQPYAPQEPASTLPYAIREFREREMAHLLNRIIYLNQVDVVQLEYTVFGQYGGDFQHLAVTLFEHDVSFQAIARGYPFIQEPLLRFKAMWEYLRMVRYELRLLPKFDSVQVCTRENRLYLESFLPRMRGRILEGLRAGIDARQYEYPGPPRRPYTLLFLGNFRHTPNIPAIQWFCRKSLPRILEHYPQTRVIVAGADPPPLHQLFGDIAGAGTDGNSLIELVGNMPDIRPLLQQNAVFICPVLSGSGVRVKLLEAFAAGIPVVSTYVGAEGLARKDGELCFLADDPLAFADRVIELFAHPERGEQMAAAAHAEVMANWDMHAITNKLIASYREALHKKNPGHAKPFTTEQETAASIPLR